MNAISTDDVLRGMDEALDTAARSPVPMAQVRHAVQTERDLEEISNRFFRLYPMPTMADLSHNDQHWFAHATIEQLLAVGVPSGPEPIMRRSAIRLHVPKPWAPWVKRADQRYSRAAQPDRLSVSRAEMAHHAARTHYVSQHWPLLTAAHPTLQPEALRLALYREYDQLHPLVDDDAAARGFETDEERLARLEQWAREGRSTQWQLLPPGPDKERAKREERELKVIRDRLRVEAKRDAEQARVALRTAEAKLRRLVPGTDEYRAARNARVAAAGRLRYNKPWHERVYEDEAAIEAQGVARPNVRSPRQLKQMATPLHSRPHMAYNRARW